MNCQNAQYQTGENVSKTDFRALQRVQDNCGLNLCRVVVSLEFASGLFPVGDCDAALDGDKA